MEDQERGTGGSEKEEEEEEGEIREAVMMTIPPSGNDDKGNFEITAINSGVFTSCIFSL